MTRLPRKVCRPRSIVLVALFYIPMVFSAESHRSNDLFDLSIEDLLSVKVSSVSKQERALSEAASSIYVITQSDIRKAGVTTLPEVLRLAPQLNVARISASQYAITARGFNSAASNKILVLIDGRTIYSPLFSGVFWDQQDVMLEDIERVEVISGPGATLWGSNAVNGVINIVTRSAVETGGLLAAAQAGNYERGIRARYGAPIGETGHFRLYAKAKDTNSSLRFDDANPHDGFRNLQAGFRVDWTSGGDAFTLQGDTYKGETDDRGLARNGTPLGNIDVRGTNILTRWQRQLDEGANFQIQAYWDYTRRQDIVLFQPRADIFDVEAQYGKTIGDHQLIVGGGYRYGHDDVDPGFFSTFIPGSRSLEWVNGFVQDEFELVDQLKATLGLKLEKNSYTGTEYLPTARLAWSHSDQSLLWAGISRAVRAPSRYDRDVYFPAPPNSLVVGGPHFESEVANVFELGYRGRAWDRLVYSATAFYHDWDKLRSGTAKIPIEVENKIEGKVFGYELWTTYELTNNWRMSAGGTRLQNELRLKPGSTNAVGVDNDILSNDPKYYAQLRSNWDLTHHTALEISVRHVAKLPHPSIPSYTLIDTHYAWQVDDTLELSVTGQNLTNKRHVEFGRPVSALEFERMVWLTATWTPM